MQKNCYGWLGKIRSASGKREELNRPLFAGVETRVETVPQGDFG